MYGEENKEEFFFKKVDRVINWSSWEYFQHPILILQMLEGLYSLVATKLF
jgi:hypothetical protein